MNNDEIEIIKKLIQYADSLDARNWSVLKSIFHENASAEYGNDSIGLKINSSSRDEIINMCKINLNGCGFTQHLLGNFKINISNNNATSACSARVYHVGKEPHQDEFYEMFGEYVDDWIKIDNSWLITSRKLLVKHEIGNRDKVLAP